MCWRKLMLCIFIISAVQMLQAQGNDDATLALLRYNAGMDAICSISVRKAAKTPQSEPRESLTVTCQGKQLLHYETQDDLIDLSLNYPHIDWVFARWEGGSHVRMTVFKVDAQHLKASTVFDEQLEGAPDVINAPDVLLVERGKRFLKGQAIWIPTSIDIFRWTGEKYALSSQWKWKEEMRFEDRFCVLDVKMLSCPVTSLPLK